MRIISLGSFWAVNLFAGFFCHAIAQMIIMNEMILSYGGATPYIFNLDFNKIKKNEFNLFNYLLKMPMLL